MQVGQAFMSRYNLEKKTGCNILDALEGLRSQDSLMSLSIFSVSKSCSALSKEFVILHCDVSYPLFMRLKLL